MKFGSKTSISKNNNRYSLKYTYRGKNELSVNVALIQTFYVIIIYFYDVHQKGLKMGWNVKFVSRMYSLYKTLLHF